MDREGDTKQVSPLTVVKPCGLLVPLLLDLSNLYMCLQLNAHEGAELELRRLQDLQREERRRREEQLEKARLRGKQALRREHLAQVQLTCYLMS